MNYHVSYQADYIEKQSRLTTFFRLLLLIPVVIVGFFWMIVAFFTIIASWFALVVTARYPAGLYAFNSGLLRAYGRMNAYAYLQTDKFPPLGIAPDPAYPIRVEIAPAQAKYSRVTVFFRAILAIPVFVVQYIFGYVIGLIAFIVWFAVVITGTMPRGLFGVLNYFLGFMTRSIGYTALLTDAYPPFGDTDPPRFPDAIPPGYPPPPGGQIYGAPPGYGQPAPSGYPTYGQPGQPPQPPVYGQPSSAPPSPPGGVDWNKPAG